VYQHNQPAKDSQKIHNIIGKCGKVNDSINMNCINTGDSRKMKQS